MTITINLSPELERELRETSAARGIPAEEIVVGALSESLRHAKSAKRPPQIPPDEAPLIAVINEGLTESEWQRYRYLKDRRRAEVLTEAERQELIAITDRLERLNATRIEKLLELARLRGVTLDQVMNQLGIRRPDPE
jgi:hypothetical protein